MSVVKQTLTSDFFQMPNSFAADLSLSPQEKAIIVYAVSKPQDWEFRRDELRKMGQCSDDKLTVYIRHLQSLGYLEVIRVHAKGLRGSKVLYAFHPHITPSITPRDITPRDITPRDITPRENGATFIIKEKPNKYSSQKDNAQSTLTNERGTDAGTDAGEFQDSRSGQEAASRKRAVYDL